MGFLLHPDIEAKTNQVLAFQSLSGFWWGFCGEDDEDGESLWGGFQSLSGFWWGFCWHPGLYYSTKPTSFNPFQGFGGVSAARSTTAGRSFIQVSIPFRVLVGFLQNENHSSRYPIRAGVSIPFRVLVGFLPAAPGEGARTWTDSFNPFQGFGGVSAGQGDPP